MDFSGNYKFLGQVNVEKLQKLLTGKNNEEWRDDVALSSQSHKQSRNIFIKNDIKPEHLYGKFHNIDKKIYEAAMDIVKQIQPNFPDCYLIRLQFVRHLPNEGFKPHTDEFSYTLINSHRVHIPIFSENKFLFSVGGEEKYMAEGEVWEINNTKIHSGHNSGANSRISMIVCFANPMKTVNERVKFFVNLESTSRSDGLIKCRPQLDHEKRPEGVLSDQYFDVEKTGKVQKGLVVAIEYSLVDMDTGAVLSENISNEPLTFVAGLDQMPNPVEEAIMGLSAGESFSCLLTPDKGYGQYYPDLCVKLPETFAAANAVPGINADIIRGIKAADMTMQALISTLIFFIPGDCPLLYKLHKKSDSSVYIEANHPFAGKNLKFNGKVLSMRELEEDERKFALYRGPSLSAAPDRIRRLKELGIV